MIISSSSRVCVLCPDSIFPWWKSGQPSRLFACLHVELFLGELTAPTSGLFGPEIFRLVFMVLVELPQIHFTVLVHDGVHPGDTLTDHTSVEG